MLCFSIHRVHSLQEKYKKDRTPNSAMITPTWFFCFSPAFPFIFFKCFFIFIALIFLLLVWIPLHSFSSYFPSWHFQWKHARLSAATLKSGELDWVSLKYRCSCKYRIHSPWGVSVLNYAPTSCYLLLTVIPGYDKKFLQYLAVV